LAQAGGQGAGAEKKKEAWGVSACASPQTRAAQPAKRP